MYLTPSLTREIKTKCIVGSHQDPADKKCHHLKRIFTKISMVFQKLAITYSSNNFEFFTLWLEHKTWLHIFMRCLRLTGVCF